MDTNRRSELIHLMNSAALGNGDDWTQLLLALANGFGASSAAIVTPESDPKGRFFGRSVGNCAISMEEYEAHWVGKDEWALGAHERKLCQRAGEAELGETVIENRRLHNTEFFNEFLRSFEITHVLSLRVTDDFDRTAPVTHISLLGDRAFDLGDRDSLQSLWRPLQRAYQAYWLLSRARSLETSAERSLDAVQIPMWVIDAQEQLFTRIEKRGARARLRSSPHNLSAWSVWET